MEDQYYDAEKYRMSSPQGTKNSIALVGLILSIVSLFFCCGFSVIAMILCIIGIVQSKKYNGDGKGAAIAGLIISIISTIFGLVFTLAAILSATPIENSDWVDTVDTTITWNNNIDY